MNIQFTFSQFSKHTYPVIFMIWRFFITGPANQSKMILDWRELEKNFPWSLLFMVGGAFAISDGAAVCIPLFTNVLFTFSNEFYS